MATEKPIHSLVIDAGPIIKNSPAVSTLLAQSEALFTIPAVIAEIRDEVARARIETTLLPFLTQRNPRPDTVKIVQDFARRTGDLAVLSKTDIQLIALARELECERNGGDWRLRNAPGQKRTNGPPPAKTGSGEASPEEKAQPRADTGAGLISEGAIAAEGENTEVSPTPATATGDLPAGTDAAPTQPVQDDADAAAAVLSDVRITDEAKTDVTSSAPTTAEQATTSETAPLAQNNDSADQASISNAQKASSSEVPSGASTQGAADSGSSASPDAQDAQGAQASTPAIAQEDDTSGTASEDSDSEGGWITPSNIKKKQAAESLASASAADEGKTMQAAIMTTDFAMQNVILQMNLNLVSPTPSLQRVKHLKTFVLRCHACFLTTKEMHRQFCPRCGKPSLTRVTCTTNANGEFKLHLKKNMQWNNRGERYSMPKPATKSASGRITSGGGKEGWGADLILAEDQKEYVRAITQEKRQKQRDLMDEDYLPSILTGERNRTGGRPKVGAGRNVNSRKRK